MTLTLAITINVLLDVAILGLLAFVMSRPNKLIPHRAEASLPSAAPSVRASRVRADLRGERVRSELQPVLD